MKKELLAPAGDIEAGYAALYYGADAVYLGLKQFSARATATNFDEGELNEFVGFAHSKGCKVYVAVNTLAQENELPQLLENLDICANCRADAVILQDLGVARVIREQYPELEMHASTQMAVHNKEGALALQRYGFKRVVLARELSLTEIKAIAAIPGLETEAFIHGALCYSYSGLCLFSSVESGRSANRGKCLYPCRSLFVGPEGEKHYFSMKDMALQEDVLRMPVTSLKIEGRKKNALYVAAVTDYYRHILDGKGTRRDKEENIKQIFSRPWSKFHFNGRDKTVIEPEFVGHRGLPIGRVEQIIKGRISFHTRHRIGRHDGIQIEIPGQEKPFGFSLQNMTVGGKSVFVAEGKDEVVLQLPVQAPRMEKGYKIYLASASEVKGAYDYVKPKAGEFRQKQPVTVTVTISEDEALASCGNYTSRIEGKFAIAEQADKVAQAVQNAFAKSGESSVFLQKLTVVNPQKRFVPVSLLNELRRGLYMQVLPEKKVGKLPEIEPEKRRAVAGWIVKTDNLAALQEIDLDEADEVILQIAPNTAIEELQILPKNKLRLALPALCRNPSAYAPLVAKLIRSGYRKWEIGNYWGLAVLPERGIDLSFDGSIYTLNSQALQMAKEMGAGRATLSIEDCMDNMQALTMAAPLPVVLPVYQDVPLFISAACIRSNPCKLCPHGEKWIKLERDGKRYDVLSRDCQTTLLSEKAVCFATQAPEIKADFYRVDFIYKKYPAAVAAKIWKTVRNFKDIDKCSKANLLFNRNF